jgi:2-hydroxy-6-oxonona-2,4-dienedioate hydrolase
MKHQSVSVMGHSVFVRFSEHNHQSKLLFVHGLGASSRYWLPLARKLVKTSDVYIPDLPGFGRSSKTPDALTIEQSAEVVNSLIATLGLKRVVLIGNSYGCQIIVDLLSRHSVPEVKQAILLGPTINRQERSKAVQVKRWLQDGKFEPSWSFAIFLRDYADAKSKRIKQSLDYAVHDRPELKLSRIHIPVLVARGGQDPTVPHNWAQEVAQKLQHGSLAEVPGAGHALNINAPDETARLINDYIGIAPRRRSRLPKLMLPVTVLAACLLSLLIMKRQSWLSGANKVLKQNHRRAKIYRY